MKQNLIIEIAVLVVLIIVFAVSFWMNNLKGAGQATSAKEACEANCIQISEDVWSSPLSGGGDFMTKEECVSNCLVKIQK